MASYQITEFNQHCSGEGGFLSFRPSVSGRQASRQAGSPGLPVWLF